MIATRVETWIDAESVALLTDHLLPGTEVRVGDRLLGVTPRDFPGRTRGCRPEESVMVNGRVQCPHAFLRYLTVEFDYHWPGPAVRGWIAASHWYESRVKIGRVGFEIRETEGGLRLIQLGRE